MAADLAAPVVDGAEAGERRGQLGDPGLGEDAGVRPRLDGGVLGRQAERVEADGAEDAVALHGPVANDQVTEGVVAHVALVGRARGVGVHAQGVELLAGIVVVDLVRARVDPVALPLALHRLNVVGACHPSRVREAGWCPEQGQGIFRAPGPAALPPARPPSGPADLVPEPPEGRQQWVSNAPGRPTAATAILSPHHWGRSSAGRAPDWQSGGSWVQVPSPPLSDAGQRTIRGTVARWTGPLVNHLSTEAYGLGADNWIAVATCAQVGVLGAAALYGVGAVNEARQLRSTQTRPYVVVYVDTNKVARSLIDLVVENIGQTPAQDVRIDFSPKLETSMSSHPGGDRVTASACVVRRDSVPRPRSTDGTPIG